MLEEHYDFLQNQRQSIEILLNEFGCVRMREVLVRCIQALQGPFAQAKADVFSQVSFQ